MLKRICCPQIRWCSADAIALMIRRDTAEGCDLCPNWRHMTGERSGATVRRMVAVLVSGTKLAGHFGLSRQHVERLAQQNVIERRPGDGLFDQDQSRLKYFAYLRAEHRRSPRTEADSEHTRVKTEMLQLKLMRQRGELVLQADVDALIDTICGCVLTTWRDACAVFARSDCPTQHRACGA